MNTRVRKRITAAVAAVAAGGALGVLSPAGPAAAEEAAPAAFDVEVASPGSLLARGLAVSVPVTVTCPSNADGYTSVYVELAERVGNQIARGYGYVIANCTGQPNTQSVAVQANYGETPFQQGFGLATASISGCTSDWLTCGYDSDTDEVAIRR